LETELVEVIEVGGWPEKAGGSTGSPTVR